MSKNFQATESKLADLREKGFFPRSVYLLRALRFAAVVFLVFFVVKTSITKADFAVFFTEKNALSSYRVFFKLLFEFLFLPLIFLLSVFVFTNIQNRFYFSLSLLKADFSRFKILNPFNLLSSRSIVIYSIWMFFLILSCGLIYFKNLKDLLGVNLEISGNLENTAKSLDSYSLVVSKCFLLFKSNQATLALTLASVFFLFGLISYGLNWWFFRMEHMMSREELEAEIREQQMSPQLRERIKEFYE